MQKIKMDKSLMVVTHTHTHTNSLENNIIIKNIAGLNL